MNHSARPFANCRDRYHLDTLSKIMSVLESLNNTSITAPIVISVHNT